MIKKIKAPRKSSKLISVEKTNAIRLISLKLYSDYNVLSKQRKSIEPEHFFENWVVINLKKISVKESSLLWKLFLEMLWLRAGN